ncbi:HIT family protein [bacterium]|nr:HIT family protein [bacterium]
MPGIFSKIINGDIPSFKVAESNDFIAFLDINPLEKGHTLVVPKIETDYIFDLDPQTYSGLWLFSARVAAAIEKNVQCRRIGIAVIGLEVPHAHVHLIPLQSGVINFSAAKKSYADGEARALSERIFESFSA